MVEITLSVFATQINVAADEESLRNIYKISGPNFSLFLSAVPTKTNDQIIQTALWKLAIEFANATNVSNLQKIMRTHLENIAGIELAAIFSTGSSNYYFLSGRFYRQVGNQIDGPEMQQLNLTKPISWKSSHYVQGRTVGYAFNSAAEIHSTGKLMSALFTQLKEERRTLDGNTYRAEEDLTKPLLFETTPSLPYKRLLLGSALVGLGIAAMVLAKTAQHSVSYAVVHLVGIKAMTLLWPIALGVGGTIALASLYHYNKQMSLFSSRSGIRNDQAAKTQSVYIYKTGVVPKS